MLSHKNQDSQLNPLAPQSEKDLLDNHPHQRTKLIRLLGLLNSTRHSRSSTKVKLLAQRNRALPHSILKEETNIVRTMFRQFPVLPPISITNLLLTLIPRAVKLSTSKERVVNSQACATQEDHLLLWLRLTKQTLKLDQDSIRTWKHSSHSILMLYLSSHLFLLLLQRKKLSQPRLLVWMQSSLWARPRTLHHLLPTCINSGPSCARTSSCTERASMEMR